MMAASMSVRLLPLALSAPLGVAALVGCDWLRGGSGERATAGGEEPDRGTEVAPTDNPAARDAGVASADAGEADADEGLLIPASALVFRETKLDVDEVTGDPEKDAFRFFRLWGEVRNTSQLWAEAIQGTVRYYDAQGKELAVLRLTPGADREADEEPPLGEPVQSTVSYIAPGATAPLYHVRSLAKLRGTYARYELTLEDARMATRYPEMTLEGPQDTVDDYYGALGRDAKPSKMRQVSGTLRNAGELPCVKPGLVVGFCVRGKLADLQQVDVEGPALPPGGSAEVQLLTNVEFDNAWKATATVKTWARCGVR